MKETFYFPHDYNASQDSKMLYLLSQCGLAGVGAYWIIIEILHQQTDCSLPFEVFKTHIRMYYFLNPINEGENGLLNICSTLVKSGLLKHDNDVVTSDRVKTNKQHREVIKNARSMAGKASANKRLRTNVQQTCQQNPTKERKGKERKGNNKEAEILSVVDFPHLINTAFLQAFEEFLKMRKKLNKVATFRAQELLLTDLHKFDLEIAVKMLEKSTRNSWLDVYALKDNYDADKSKSKLPPRFE